MKRVLLLSLSGGIAGEENPICCQVRPLEIQRLKKQQQPWYKIKAIWKTFKDEKDYFSFTSL